MGVPSLVKNVTVTGILGFGPGCCNLAVGSRLRMSLSQVFSSPNTAQPGFLVTTACLGV